MSLDLSKPTDILYKIDQISVTQAFIEVFEKFIGIVNDKIKSNVLFCECYINCSFKVNGYTRDYITLLKRIPHAEHNNYFNYFISLYKSHGYLITKAEDTNFLTISWKLNFTIDESNVSYLFPLKIEV